MLLLTVHFCNKSIWSLVLDFLLLHLFSLQIVIMLSILGIISCLLFLMVNGKTEKDTDTLIHVILREQASMIKHCMSNVCTRNMYNPGRPVKPWNRKMVAFSAYPSHDFKSIAANTIIVLDKTRTNVGNAYSTTTGVFTVPIDGVYAFHWTLLNARGRYTGIHIQVNGRNKMLLYGNAKNSPNWFSASQSYVTELKLGDKVNLFTDGNSGGYVHDYSSFTGYRL